MGKRQILVVILGFFATMFDGLDTTSASFVYPQMVQHWGTPVAAITALVTIGTIGVAAGALAAGPMADRIGRKAVVIASISLFGLATAAQALATNVEAFGILRTLAALGLGAVIPTVVTLVAEFTPEKHRAAAVTTAFTGLAVGLAAGGYLAAAIVPQFGWQMLVAICGLTTVVFLPVFIFLVPESATFLALKGHSNERIQRTIQVLAPGADTTNIEFGPESTVEAESGGIRTVLSRRYLATSILLWVCYFVGLGVIYLLLSYLPLMVTKAGFTVADAGFMVGLFGWGTVAGSFFVGAVQGKFGRFRVVAIVWALGSVAIWMVSALAYDFAGLLTLVFFIGFLFSGANTGMQANAAFAYPTAARATGVAWMSGVGRFGNVASGVLGGLMIGAGWSIGQIFFTLAFPPIAGIMAVIGLSVLTRRHAETEKGMEVQKR